MRLHIIVEGQTEERFVKKTLAPHLGRLGVFADASCVATSWDKKRNIKHKGGFRRHDAYEPARKDIMSWLKQDRDSDCRFTTMFDLYALPEDFPGYREALATQDKYERVAVLEKALAQDLEDYRFIPYIQLHEFEALILAEPKSLGCQYLEHDDAIQNLIDMVEKQGGNPELINDNYETCPSRRIISEIPEYRKASSGVTVADKIGIQTMRKNCKHFNDWLTKLEEPSR